MLGTFNVVHALLWLRMLVAGLCRRRPGFNASLVYMGVVVGLGATRRILLGLIQFSTDILIPRTPHAYSFNCHRSLLKTIENVVNKSKKRSNHNLK
jgi:hypothetical protein